MPLRPEEIPAPGYWACRDLAGRGIIVRLRASAAYRLPLRRDLANHSPAGLNWGHGGSGTAQLALALLADFFGHTPAGDRLAVALHQTFKWKCGVCGTPAPRWWLSDERLRFEISKLLVDDIDRQAARVRRARDDHAAGRLEKRLEELERQALPAPGFETLEAECFQEADRAFHTALGSVTK